MTTLGFVIKKSCFVLVFVFCFSASGLLAQEPTKSPEQKTNADKPKDEVLRINTNLIQTGVGVFDKKGLFVSNLKKEDFELSVDGKPIPVSFFEQVVAKSSVKTANDKIKTEQSDTIAINANAPAENNAARRGRTILFLVDDLHLTFDNLRCTRDLILKFIEREMEPDDVAAIVSTNDKLGFLQQFTSDKTVLRAAIGKLVFTRDNSGITRFSPRMTEYEALLIDRRDTQTTESFVSLLAKQNPEMNIESLQEQARSQARTTLSQAAVVSRRTYSTLQKAIRDSAEQPGRKIVFLLSEGFLLDTANTDASYQLGLITDAAARANAVIYSFDANGLLAALPDDSSDANTTKTLSDFASSESSSKNAIPSRISTANSYRVLSGERFESQDGLNLLAEKTGGRFIHDTNDLWTEMSKAFAEASAYYLLAWEPESENDKTEKLRRIEITVKNRPDLKVRMQNWYLNRNLKTVANKPNSTNATESSKTLIELPKTTKPALSIADEQLNTAINSQVPKSDLVTSLALNYIDVPNEGATAAAVLQIKSDAVEFATKDEEATAKIDLLGVIYDSKGARVDSFRKLLTFNVSAAQLDEDRRENFYYNYQTKLKPGLYQMRIAARHVKSGRLGSALQWIEIPDLSARKLALSSLLISETSDEDEKPRKALSESPSALGEIQVSVERRFERSSALRYLIFIYNAARGQTLPDVTVQTQILRGNAPIMTAPARPISAEGQDLTRLPYAGEITLEELLPGRYELQVTVEDRIAKTSATQRLSFEIK